MQKLKSEPERALIADKQGMADIETIITQGKDWLKPNGWIVLEHGYDQGQRYEIFLNNKVLSRFRLSRIMVAMTVSV